MGLILMKTLIFSYLGVKSSGFVISAFRVPAHLVLRVELLYLWHYFERDDLLDLFSSIFLLKSIVMSFCLRLNIFLGFESSLLLKKPLKEL